MPYSRGSERDVHDASALGCLILFFVGVVIVGCVTIGALGYIWATN